ncbi:MAG: glycosyltransferase family 2 protein, partial [Chlorobi bacterium]|nr:glycosyltransferase family 2 protein [Chlorobiota bacterium]
MSTISAVVLHYRAEPFLRLQLESLVRAARRHGRTEIIVADNASPEFDPERWRQIFPEIRFLQFEKNEGFGKGNNRAVREAQGEYVLLLNPDTVVPEDLPVKLEEIRRQYPHRGITGVRLIDGRGRFLPESKRNLPTLAGSLARLTGLERLPFWPPSLSYYNRRIPPAGCGPNDVFVGAFMFFKRRDFLNLGGFDERFFMYGEDIDLSKRFKEAGLDGFYCGQTAVVHFKGESTP